MANTRLDMERLKATLAASAVESAARWEEYKRAHSFRGTDPRLPAPVTTPSGRVYHQLPLAAPPPPPPPPPPDYSSWRGGVGVVTITSVSVTQKGEGYVGTIKGRSSVRGPVYVHGYHSDPQALLAGLWGAVEKERWHKDRHPR